jgi:uncharacterized membrane protein YgaE (UPF0421/DUF939 family)
MLEILLLFWLGRKIAAIAGDKGRSGVLFVILLLFLWIGGEFFGAILGAVISIMATGQEEPNFLMVYGLALLGAATGAVISFLIAHAVPPVDDRTVEDYR